MLIVCRCLVEVMFVLVRLVLVVGLRLEIDEIGEMVGVLLLVIDGFCFGFID